MAEEDKNKGKDPQTPASEPKDQGQKPENAGNTAELDALKKTLIEKEDLLKKQEKQLDQAGFNIQKYKQKLKDAGIDDEEGQLGKEQLEEAIQSAVKPALEKISQLETTLTEIARANKAKDNIGGDGGSGGQRPPENKEMEEPSLSETDKKLILSFGGKWDGEKKGWTTKSGKFIPYNDISGLAPSV